jgi:dienelactone hydrolase
LRLVRKGQPAASAELVQAALGDGVRRLPVREGALRGVFFSPAGGSGAGVLALGGSNGGAPLRQAAWLASRGFAALALAYFHYEDLPANLEAIPLEYFGEALNWLAGRPEVAGDRLAVMGVSRGGELALQLGSMYPRIGAVVAYVPANVRYPACCGDNRKPYAWTWQGSPLPYLPLRLARDPSAARNAAIEVERIRGPILMVSGQDDGVWRSREMAAAAVTRLKQAHFPYEVQHLEYRGAGHAAGRPEIQPAWHGIVPHPVSGRPMRLGGTARGDAQSTLDATPRVLAFLRKYMQASPAAGSGAAPR